MPGRIYGEAIQTGEVDSKPVTRKCRLTILTTLDKDAIAVHITRSQVQRANYSS